MTTFGPLRADHLVPVLSRRFGAHPSLFRRWLADDPLEPSFSINGRRYHHPADVEAWIKRKLDDTRPTAAPAPRPAATAAASGPRTLHGICELARLAACPCCHAAGLEWPCVGPGTGPDGFHVARFAAAMRRGLITGTDLMTVLNTAGAFSNTTVIFDAPAGAR
jgi:hypothetical protein